MRTPSPSLARLAAGLFALLPFAAVAQTPPAAQTPPPIVDIAALRADIERKARAELAGPNPSDGTKGIFGDAGAVKVVPLSIDQDERFIAALVAAGDKPVVQVGLPGAEGTKKTGMKSVGGQKITDKTIFQQVTLALELPDQGYCSGVLIDRQTIVTAAHCFCGGDIRHVRFGISARDTQALSQTIAVAQQKYRDGLKCPGPGVPFADHVKSLFGRDIGMLRLAVPVPAAWVTAPSKPADPKLIHSQFKAGNKSLFVVGFGHTEAGDQDEKSIARVPILSPDCSDSSPRRGTDAAFYGCVKGAEILAMDSKVAGPCPGDSGGGAFMTVADPASGKEETHLVGLVSRSIAKPLRKCGDGAIYTLLTPEHIAWIEQTRSQFAGTVAGAANKK